MAGRSDSESWKRRGKWVPIAGIVIFVIVTRGPQPPTPNPPDSFSFAALGDAPYYIWEDLQYRVVLDDLEAHDLSSVLVVGDIFWRPCSEKIYRKHLGWFNDLRHPVIFTPGDNEWPDCWEPGSGGFAPLERLERLREIFFAEPESSLGGSRRPLASQRSGPGFTEFVENVRWVDDTIVFATVHIVGSGNATEPFPERAQADDDAAVRRTAAAAAWVRETFSEARKIAATAVVVAFHGNPAFEAPADDPYRLAFEPFITVLEEEVERFAKPVLAVHGDDHEFLVDHPLSRRTTGHKLENFTRLQVPGSPDVGRVRVVVTPGAPEPFAFEEYVVPRWKYW